MRMRCWIRLAGVPDEISVDCEFFGELQPMTSARWSDEMLDAMRLVGDPPADAAIEAIFAAGQLKDAQAFMSRLMTNDAALPHSIPPALRNFLESNPMKPFADPSCVEAAQNLFLDQRPRNSDYAWMLCAARRLCRAQRRQGSPSDRVSRQAP